MASFIEIRKEDFTLIAYIYVYRESRYIKTTALTSLFLSQLKKNQNR